MTAGCQRRADIGDAWCFRHAPPLAWWRHRGTGELTQWGYPPPASYDATTPLGPDGQPYNDYLAEHYPHILAAG
jgi:hypothetical protein